MMTTQVLERHEENRLGLPYPIVLLNAAEKVTHPKTGEIIGVAIPNSEELARGPIRLFAWRRSYVCRIVRLDRACGRKMSSRFG